LPKIGKTANLARKFSNALRIFFNKSSNLAISIGHAIRTT
jgi:hypothetical protein